MGCHRLGRSGGRHDDGLWHPVLGPLTFDYSAFAINSRSDLSMVVYSPVGADDLDRIGALLKRDR